MFKINFQILFLAALLQSVFSFGQAKSAGSYDSKIVSLNSGWKMQQNNQLKGVDGGSISLNGFDTGNWFKAEVPGTVLGSLALNKVIEDPTFGINMQKVDTVRFKFNQPWWFRTTFRLTKNELKQNISLRFNGICYRADLWINGKKVSEMDFFAGTYRMFTFNVNQFVQDAIIWFRVL